MKKVLNLSVGFFAAAMMSCGGSGGGPNGSTAYKNRGCTMTQSGVVGTRACGVEVQVPHPATAHNPGYILINRGDYTEPVIRFYIEDNDPKPSTLTSNDNTPVSAYVQNSTPPSAPRWDVNINNGIPKVGSYTLNITAVTTLGGNSMVTIYLINGTLDATYEADPTTGAMGTVQVHAEF